MPKVVADADQATELALTFAKKHRKYVRPIQAKQTDGKWTVELDFGVLAPRIGTVVIDTENGEILEYSFPPGT